MEELLRDFEMSDIEVDIADTDSSSGNTLIHVVLFLFLWSSFYGILMTALNHLIQFFITYIYDHIKIFI